MDDPTQQQTDSEHILPAVHSPVGDIPMPAAPVGGSSQTIPDDRALVPIPDEAADSDLIEKEWVIKAKEIVDQTAEDPFLQQQELAKMKSAYMKKRYNRDIGQTY